MIQMEGTSAYYNQTLTYGGEGYNVSTTGYPMNQQPACVYARNNGVGGYGGQNMSVVEQGLQGLANNSNMHIQHAQGLHQANMQHMSPSSQSSMANTTPAHMQSPHQQMAAGMGQIQMATPPPAHQPQVASPMSPGIEDSSVHNSEKNQSSNLQFPWMKTTKSHAAQWKAQWPEQLERPGSISLRADTISEKKAKQQSQSY
ncbi:pancreas/duodenum homeobox protein 1-like isoform X2 [Mya arenaria]|uniref:pancreas/duodenum homeobox protein 1-like isoform X2 n=1 Tax=Mya arenaria TaxID=6604 RepID=UPI0022E5775E|nr:pancreas/duodenum homeobox protein 1-like isoform X2 [Mya arenaria]